MPDRNEAKVSRRNFLTVSGGIAAAGLAGLSVAPIFSQDSQPTESKGEVVYRTLGKTGLKLPIVSMGVMNARVPNVLQAAYEAGIRHFDTATLYQNGTNEQMVGTVIKRLGVRDKVVIATKIYHRSTRRGDSPEEVKKQIEMQLTGCLRRLKTDYVDIVYIHSVQAPEVVKDQAIMDGLASIKKKGMARNVGIASHTRMADNIMAAVETGFYDVFLTSINFTMADDTALLQAIAAAKQAGLGVIAMKTMAGGSRWPNPESRRAYNSETIAKASLKWVLRNENISTAIPGFTSFEHMNQDFSVASNLEYTPEEEKLLNDNAVVLGMEYCRQCQKCLATCPNGVNIPKLMRVHMYAAQYGNLLHARSTYDEIPGKQSLDACKSCSDCVAECARSNNIKHRMEELYSMYA